MRRRELLAGVVGLTVLGGGAAYAVGEFSVGDPSDEEEFEQFELPGIEAPGSEAATITVPEKGQVSFVELFATSCGVCQQMMPELRAASEEIDNGVQFVSVTNEPVGHSIEVEGVAEWWADHGGNWQLAHDANLDLTRELNANMVPYAAVFDTDNRLVWSDGGYKSAEKIGAVIADTR